MLIIRTGQDLQMQVNLLKNKGLKIGFVPTMGALHPGHLSLVKTSLTKCDITVCSIFVNPRQFNDPEDLKRYPRTPEKDQAMLEKAKCHILFVPEADELYTDHENEQYQFGELDKVLEGRHRPGHFNGVAQVLKRFFTLVQPDLAFFGQKDYQQLLVVKALVKQLKIPVQIIACPIEREQDGLAMSSRNTLLSPAERILASGIPEMMQKSLNVLKKQGIKEAKDFVFKEVSRFPEMKLDYFEICEPETLVPLQTYLSNQTAVALIAVYVGKVRLIDNIVLSAQVLKV
ncbi:MAG TPA: pantoate--beta-alanine ligase [Bacteroidia bacterium]|nr:pantoate--beta-alanine ligase [Bacteroidia bacterium]